MPTVTRSVGVRGQDFSMNSSVKSFNLFLVINGTNLSLQLNSKELHYDRFLYKMHFHGCNF